MPRYVTLTKFAVSKHSKSIAGIIEIKKTGEGGIGVDMIPQPSQVVEK